MDFLRKLKHYNIPAYTVFCAILFLLGIILISDIVVDYAADSGWTTTEEDLRFWTPFMCLAIGVVFFLHDARETYYSDKTGGRSYSKDRTYKYTFFQLLEYFKNADPHRMDISSFPDEDYHKADGLIFGTVDGKVIRRPSSGEGCCLLTGGPGTGKTSSTVIMSSRNWGLENRKENERGHGVLLIDIKGDIYNANKDFRSIKVFNPDDPQSCCFDPMRGMAQMTPAERYARIEELSEILVEDEPGETGAFFTDGARAMLCGIFHLVLYKDINAKLPVVVDAVLSGSWNVAVQSAIASNCTEAKRYLAGFRDANERNNGSLYSTMTKSIRRLVPALHLLGGASKDAPEKLIDINTLEEHDIYIVIAQDRLSSYAQIINLLVSSFMEDFMRRPDRGTSDEKASPVLFLLDEFPQIHIPFGIIQSALATLRSKNITVYMICQSLAQLQYLYGRDGCRSLLDSTPYQICMGAVDPETQKYYSSLVGSRKDLRLSITDSGKQGGMSRSVQQVRELIFQPEDIGDLKEQVLIIANGTYILADKAYYYK